MEIEATHIVRDDGSVIVFGGTTDSGQTVHFAVDHRIAQGLADALAEEGSIPCEVESWQILGGF